VPDGVLILPHRANQAPSCRRSRRRQRPQVEVVGGEDHLRLEIVLSYQQVSSSHLIGRSGAIRPQAGHWARQARVAGPPDVTGAAVSTQRLQWVNRDLGKNKHIQIDDTVDL